MKRTLISLILILIAVFTGTAHAEATKEDWCLKLGQIAGKAAELRDHKIPEDQLYKMVESKNKRVFTSVISYVYTMGSSPADSRKLVYLKCLADEFQADE